MTTTLFYSSLDMAAAAKKTKKQPSLVEHFLPHLVADDLRLPKPAMLYIRDVVSILTKPPPPPPPRSSSRPSSSSFLSFFLKTFSYSLLNDNNERRVK